MTNQTTSFGIGYGQNTRGGGWRNEHFETREHAEAAIRKLRAEVESNFSHSSRSWTGKFSVDISADESNPCALENIAITNLKKNGTRGAVTFTIRLYSFTAPICDSWYRRSCPGCKHLQERAVAA